MCTFEWECKEMIERSELELNDYRLTVTIL